MEKVQGTKASLFQTEMGGLEVRTVVSAEQVLNQGMLVAIKTEILNQAVEKFFAVYGDDLLSSIDIKEVASKFIDNLDLKAVANGIAKKVVERVFDEKCQEIIGLVNLTTVANMTAAYTARLAADSLVTLPKAINGRD